MQELKFGYAGKQLRISLRDKKVKVEDVNPDVMRKYLGGAGYGARILFDELEKGIDPLAPANKLLFATSPLTANKIPGGGSIIVCFKSPLTNTWGESRCGGDFGPDLKSAGYDVLIIEDRSDEPVYIYINDDTVQIKPAAKLAGRRVPEKIGMIRRELGDDRISVMCIGPAGEKLVKIATVMFEQRAAGRCGVGAVMGSKNLLGIAVKGSHELNAAEPDRLKKAVKKALDILRENETAAGFKEHGTTGDMVPNDTAGDWPTKNWHSNSWGKAE